MIVTAGRTVGVGLLGGSFVSRLCRRLAVAVMVVGLAWLLAVGQARAALPANCVAGTASVSCSFAYTGAEQTFAVPSGATSVDVEAIGAAGETSIFGGAVGGRGAVVSGEVAVTGSSTLYVEVGGTPTAPASGCYPANPCTGGFNGGGGGGFYGPGGGGASDVRTHTRADTAATLASRLIVAAGGGGGGDDSTGLCSPGGAGGDAGMTGGDGPSCGITGATGGSAGTSSAGGAGGVAAAGNGGSGSLGQGGESQGSGGGGGGGLYGGGAGGENDSDESGNLAGAGGGGGGSNLVPAGGSGEVTTDPASVVISYAVPMASITTPADGAVYALGQQVSSSFTCADVSGGPGISSCVDQNGNPSGSPVDTSTLGSHTFTVTATNADGLVAQQSVAYTVAKAQAIAFTSSPPSPAVFGGSYTPAATGGGSGNPVVFSIDSSSGAGVCSLSSGTVSLTGAGTCVVDADQAGNADYEPAAEQQQSFTVVKASQAIAFTSSPPRPAVFGGSYTPAATGGGSGNPVVFSIDSSSGAGVCSLSSGTVSFTGAGTCVVDADQAGNADYEPAAQQQQSFTVVKPPSALISSPADGQTFALGQHVGTSFSCAEGADGPGISSCSDPNGASAPAGVLDTSKTGTFAYTVTAASKDGQSARASIHYTVAGAPSAQISSPADGATYTRGQITAASYICRDGASGPGINACTGTIASGAPIDTSQPGPHTFTVTATSIDGQRTAVSVHYTVALPSNRFTVRHLKVHHNGTIEFDVTVPYAGQLDVLATNWKPSPRAVHAMLLRPGPHRYAFAHRHLNLARAATLHLKIRPTARGRRQVHRHHRPVRINLWLTYQPAHGVPANAAFTNLLVTK
jgi:Glycine rich protein